MEISITSLPGISLRFASVPEAGGKYATSHLQKGFLLVADGKVLAEEAVGFGVPVLKRGLQAVFPGGMTFTTSSRGDVLEIAAVFSLDLEERFTRTDSNSVGGPLFYRLKNQMAALIRRVPLLRPVLTGTSSLLRALFGWRTTYERAGFQIPVQMTYCIDRTTGKMSVTVDLSNLENRGVTEAIVMNEQGAHFFDRYREAGGSRLFGKRIGTWDAVVAEAAAFECPAAQVAFKLARVEGAHLYRGRELVGSRLAWSGFGYSFQPGMKIFQYELTLERLP